MDHIIKQFAFEGTLLEKKPWGNGHINDTYCIESPRCILQRINTKVFKNPDELMENIENVTAFLRDKIIQASGILC